VTMGWAQPASPAIADKAKTLAHDAIAVNFPHMASY
jgi:hypothetical protein